MHKSVAEFVCPSASQVCVMRMASAALDAAKAMSACMRISVQVIASQLDFKAHVALHLIVALAAAQMVFV